MAVADAKHAPAPAPAHGHAAPELDPEAALALERAEQFFASTTAPAFTAAAEKSFAEWAAAQHRAGRRIICVTSGGTTVPLEQNTVRFIDNFSTGSRGAACTEHFVAPTAPAVGAGAADAKAEHPQPYAVLLLRRSGSVCPFARHMQRFLNAGAAAGAASTAASSNGGGNAFDLSLFGAIQSVDDSGRLVLAPPKAASAAAASATAAAAAELKRQVAAYQSAVADGRLLCHEFTSISEYLFLFRAAALALAPLKADAALFLAAAVSDFYVPQQQQTKHKIQSAGGPLNISLPQVPKLLKLLKARWAPACFAVSFKLETDASLLLKKSRGAIASYGVDAVVANQLNTRNDTVVVVLAQPHAQPAQAQGAPKLADAPVECVLIARKAGGAGEIEAPLCRIVSALHKEFAASKGQRMTPAAAGAGAGAGTPAWLAADAAFDVSVVTDSALTAKLGAAPAAAH